MNDLMQMQERYERMTAEERAEFIDKCIFCDGFEKVPEELMEGKHTREIELIVKQFSIPEKSLLHGLAMFYAAGVNHGFELASKMYEEEQQH